MRPCFTMSLLSYNPRPSRQQHYNYYRGGGSYSLLPPQHRNRPSELWQRQQRPMLSSPMGNGSTRHSVFDFGIYWDRDSESLSI